MLAYGAVQNDGANTIFPWLSSRAIVHSNLVLVANYLPTMVVFSLLRQFSDLGGIFWTD